MAGTSPSAIKQSTENVRYAMRANYARRAARRRRMRRFEDHTTSASNRGPSRQTRPRQRPGPRSRQAGPPRLPSRLAAKVNVGIVRFSGFQRSKPSMSGAARTWSEEASFNCESLGLLQTLQLASTNRAKERFGRQLYLTFISADTRPDLEHLGPATLSYHCRHAELLSQT